MLKFALVLVFASGAPLVAADALCDRACLKTTLDQYLKGVTEHNPAAVPLSAGYRETNNAVVVRQGNGVWKTVTALGKMQRRFFDAVNGQAAYFGLMQEGENTAIATVRIKVEDRKVTEAEWVVGRKGDIGLNGPAGANPNLFDANNLAATPPPERTLAKSARLSRTDMVGITNSYFDAITTHDGSIMLALPGCLRVENGVTVTGRPLQPNAVQANGWKTSDCTSSLANINISNVAGRRYPLIDEEAGVILGIVVFQRKPGTPQRRNLLSEFFFLEDQKIRSIYAAMFYPAPDAPAPNWGPYEGNWPLPASFGEAK